VRKFLPQPQINQTFPSQSTNPDYSESFLPNAAVQFTGFKGQGYLLVRPDAGIEDFELYINGAQVDTKALKKNKINKIDISALVRNGKNTVEVYNVLGKGEVRVQVPFPEIVDGLEEYKGNSTFKLIDAIISAEVAKGFPAAQLVVIKDGKLVKRTNYGYVNNFDEDGRPLKVDDKRPVSDDTIFDLASNTKMYATNFALQKLVYEGKISVDDPINKYIHNFYDKEEDLIKGKNDMTIKDLLTHQSGFRAGLNLYTRDQNGKVIKYNPPADREQLLEAIINAPLANSPRTRALYSDIDFLLLGLIIEEVSGKPLHSYVKETFYKPLDLKHISYLPLKNGFSKKRIVATTVVSPSIYSSKGRVVWGTVQDPTASALGGLAGHAGLFSNAFDLAKLAQVMLNGGGYGDKRFFDPSTIEIFTQSQDINDTFALGWRKQGASLKYSNMFSSYASKDAIGHSGWTGTITIIDPQNNLVIVLLTSKKNSPAIANGRTHGDRYITGQYSAIASLVYSAFDDDSSQTNESRIAFMIREKQKLIESLKGKAVPPDTLSLEALIEAQANFLGY
jgi:CubicO group peptidase (beta-lactamase class C family)